MLIQSKRLHPDAKLPTYAHDYDAGMDLYTVETVTVQPNERVILPTGIALAIPPGYVGLLWDKSGMAAKFGLKSMGGVLDSGYRGEIKVIMHNLSKESYTFEKGKKIVQLLIQPIFRAELREVEELPETERNQGKFGSTGLH